MKKEMTVDTETASAAGDDIILGSSTSAIVPSASEAMIGDFDSSDIRFPLLQVVQGVGPLSETHAKGVILLNGETVLSEGGAEGSSVELTVCKIGKMFEENIPYGNEEIPRIVNTKEEVLQHEGTTEWGRDEDGKTIQPSWKAIAEAMICITQPKGAGNDNFPYAFGKKNYAFAAWKIKGVAYRRAAVEIFSAAAMYYRAGLKTGTFELTTEKAVFGQNTVFVPRLVKGGKNSDEFVSWLSEFV